VTRSAKEIQDWMSERLSRLMGVLPQDIDPREPIRRYGLDSVALVTFTTDLEDWLATPGQPTGEPLPRYRFHSNPLDDHPTVEALAAFLAQETAKATKPTGDA
jgi:acyl carrier protein